MEGNVAVQRLMKVRSVVLSAIFVLSLLAFGVGLAQGPRADRDERAERRAARAMDERIEKLEGRVDAMKAAHDSLQLEVKTQLAEINTYLRIGTWIVGTIAGVMLAQFANALFGKGAALMSKPKEG